MPSTSDQVIIQNGVRGGDFRHVLGHFCSGVTVVTGLCSGPRGPEPAGFTCQSFVSLSLDPPLVAVAVGHSSTTWPRIRRTGAFAVNILTARQERLGRAFAVRGADKFAGVGWRPAQDTGSPLLDGVLAWLDCTIEAVHPGGDHSVVVGRVRALEAGDPGAEPLLFYRAAFHRPSSEAEAR
jgi:3-hydroxy-9,10-secoandrosta-1,3,5(10)-triene-9,17-dione monooxygenase reductase component